MCKDIGAISTTVHVEVHSVLLGLSEKLALLVLGSSMNRCILSCTVLFLDRTLAIEILGVVLDSVIISIVSVLHKSDV